MSAEDLLKAGFDQIEARMVALRITPKELLADADMA